MAKIGLYPSNYTNQYINLQKQIIGNLGYELEQISVKQYQTKVSELPDILIFNWLENGSGKNKIELLIFYTSWVIEFIKCKIKNKKTVVVFHNKKVHDGSKLKTLLSQTFMFSIFRLSSAVIVLTEDSKKYLGKLVPKRKLSKVFVVPHINFINENLPLCVPNNKKMQVCFVGLIRPYKNTEMIFKLASECRDLEIDFNIKGQVLSENYFQQLEYLSKDLDNVHFVSEHLTEEEIESEIRSSDILILPYSINSSMNSGVAILAFSHGRPVISPAISTILDYPIESNYVYEYTNEKEHYCKLKEQLLKAYNDWKENKEAFQNNGKCLYELVKENNSKEKVAKAYKRVFEYLESQDE